MTGNTLITGELREGSRSLCFCSKRLSWEQSLMGQDGGGIRTRSIWWGSWQRGDRLTESQLLNPPRLNYPPPGGSFLCRERRQRDGPLWARAQGLTFGSLCECDLLPDTHPLPCRVNTSRGMLPVSQGLPDLSRASKWMRYQSRMGHQRFSPRNPGKCLLQPRVPRQSGPDECPYYSFGF